MKFTNDTIADLTPEEFGARYEAFKLLVAKELKVAQDAAEDDTINNVTNIDYFDRHTVDSDSIYDADIEDVLETIKEFEESSSEYKDKRGFYVSNQEEISGDYEDSYVEVDYIGWRASWLEPKEEITEGTINNEFREFARNWLAPEGRSGWDINHIDCKLLTLFKEGKIDWNTLRTLVYSDCTV